MTYRTTRQADLDIAEIYVAGEQAFGTRQAERYQDGLFRTVSLLADNPYLASERTWLTPPVRIHPYSAHLIVYVVDEAGVLVVRILILHGRQDWERWLTAEP